METFLINFGKFKLSKQNLSDHHVFNSFVYILRSRFHVFFFDGRFCGFFFDNRFWGFFLVCFGFRGFFGCHAFTTSPFSSIAFHSSPWDLTLFNFRSFFSASFKLSIRFRLCHDVFSCVLGRGSVFIKLFGIIKPESRSTSARRMECDRRERGNSESMAAKEARTKAN